MRLSLCIPTHTGRADKLEELLESVAVQLGRDVPFELCVSDNASTDRTREVIDAFRERLGDRMVYRRNEVDLGFTGNLLGAVAAARGDYVWLCGSDDKLTPGAVAEALALLDRHPEAEGFCVGRRHFEDFPPFREDADNPRYLPPDWEREQVFTDAEEALAAFGHLQGYISTQILRRSAWVAALARITEEDLRRARNFPHLEIIGRMMLADPHWVWFPGELVLRRTAGQPLEGQAGESEAHFWVVELADRQAVWGRLFAPGSRAFKRLMTAAWRDHANWRQIVLYKATPGWNAASDRLFLRELPKLFGWLPAFWLTSVPILVLLPHPLAKWAVRQHGRLLTARR